MIKPGDKFKRLTVVKRDITRENKKNSYYICLCSCGTKKSILRSSLLSGTTCSCGCLRKENAATLNKNKIIDETGSRYGKLFVVERSENTDKGMVSWLCHCDCGNKSIVEGSSLRSGNSTSCGCKRAETIRSLPSQAKDEVGNRYGKLTVIRRGENDGKLAQWWCRCECGSKEVLKNGSRLRAGGIKSCGCLEKLNRQNNCKKRKIKHGLHNHPLYHKYHSIKARCYRESAPDYSRYGGRGIVMCNEWLKNVDTFINWAIKNGWKKGARLSVDRIDNNGNYCPENCRIIGVVENTIKRYTDRGQGLSVSGKSVNIREIIRTSGASPNTVKKLVLANYSEEDIIKYGKLFHYQKMAVSLSIKAKDPLSMDEARKIKRKHKKRVRPPGYVNYMGMLGRCNNPSNKAYHLYGGRGIKVSDEWQGNYKRFFCDMGAPPFPDAAIHRIDENKNYSASNCIWFTRSENTHAMHDSKKTKKSKT